MDSNSALKQQPVRRVTGSTPLLTPRLARQSPGRGALVGLLILFFAAVSIMGSPFLYDRANSGRYLLSVLRATDQELFQNDPVVDALGRFRSLFYDGLVFGFQVTQASPMQLETVLYMLYLLSKLLLVMALYLVARSLDRNLWLFVLLAAWASHQKGAPVGGVSLFTPSLVHSDVALLLGLTALYFLFTNRPLLFWLPLAVALVIHPLVTLQLVIIVLPPVWLFSDGFGRAHGLGLALFAGSLLLYQAFLAPPGMSAAEAQIFLAAKGGMAHISPLAQNPLDWLKLAGLVSLALLAYRQVGPSHKNSKLLAGFILSGTCSGLLLAMAAVTTEITKLALFQPLRIFLWVTFFVYLLLMATSLQALREMRPVGVILLGVILMSMLESLWELGFIALGIGYLLAALLTPRLPHLRRLKLNTVFKVGLAVLVTGMGLAWLLGERQPFESFRDPAPVIIGLGLLLLLPGALPARQYRWAAVGCLVAGSLVGASIYRHRYYEARLDDDWYAVRRWVQQNTAKEARFITATASNNGGNFRTVAWRTSLNEAQSALAWVDPVVYLENGRAAGQVRQAYNGSTWNMGQLLALAEQWEVDYLLVEGATDPPVVTIFRQGPYSVVRAPGVTNIEESDETN